MQAVALLRHPGVISNAAPFVPPPVAAIRQALNPFAFKSLKTNLRFMRIKPQPASHRIGNFLAHNRIPPKYFQHAHRQYALTASTVANRKTDAIAQTDVELLIQEIFIMKNTTKTTDHEMQTEDRQFYFGMTAATLLSFAITFIAAELI